MKQGKTLVDLAKELERLEGAKRDFIADTRQIQVAPSAALNPNITLDDIVEETELTQRQNESALSMIIENTGNDDFICAINNHAMNQIGSRLGIPKKYVDKLAEKHPDMLAYNINNLFEREPEKRMVRTLEGRVRAFMSDRYRIIDNFDVANVVLPALLEARAEIISCDVTWKKLYIKARHPSLEHVIQEFPEGVTMGDGSHHSRQTVRAAVVITNSEVGLSRLGFSPAIWTHECSNLMVSEKYAYSKYHIGRQKGKDEDHIWELLSDDTKMLSDATVVSKIKDLARASMDGTIFDKIVDSLKDSRHQEIKGNVVETVELLAREKGLIECEKTSILTELIKGGDLTKYGLHAAVTRMSTDVQDYDRASDLEKLGGKIIEMPQREWEAYAVAA